MPGQEGHRQIFVDLPQASQPVQACTHLLRRAAHATGRQRLEEANAVVQLALGQRAAQLHQVGEDAGQVHDPAVGRAERTQKLPKHMVETALVRPLEQIEELGGDLLPLRAQAALLEKLFNGLGEDVAVTPGHAAQREALVAVGGFRRWQCRRQSRFPCASGL